MTDGADGFLNLLSRNRKNIVQDAQPAHPLPTSPLKGEGLKAKWEGIHHAKALG